MRSLHEALLKGMTVQRLLPSLDDYDLQGVRPDEAALWGDDVRYAVEAREDDSYAGTAFIHI